MIKNLRVRLPILRILMMCSVLSVFSSSGFTQEISKYAKKYKLSVPTKDVVLKDGLFKNTFDNNVNLLLTKFQTDTILYNFRLRAGVNAPGAPLNGWEDYVPGSIASAFLMGAGNSLRWTDNFALLEKMNYVVSELDRLKETDGFIMAYPEEKYNQKENSNYVRSWMTHGLIDANIAGNIKALPLLRGYLDWFYSKDISKVVDKEKGYKPDSLWIPYQGMISSTRMYFTPLGKKKDIEVVKMFYQEDWWLDQLINNDDKAIYCRPEHHCYEITALEAYLDLYIGTGETRYLQAVLNAHRMLREKWQIPGGAFTLCEHSPFPPKSYFIDNHYKSIELCGAVFWVKLNQRLHMLFPDVEEYVNEIEKSIFNVCIPNQVGDKGIRYHAALSDKKEKVSPGSCCEGQGTRLYSSLPEYLYSFSPNGIYVDLYSASKISWVQYGEKIELANSTIFPNGSDVDLVLKCSKSVKFTISLRIPSWTAEIVEIKINGEKFDIGMPGSYCHIERIWKDGDHISFSLSMKARISKYEGFDQYPGFSRYSVEFGPILLAARAEKKKGYNFRNMIRLIRDPMKVQDWLIQRTDTTLHFEIKIDDGTYWRMKQWEGIDFVPYYEIQNELFDVYPIIQN
jgi:uncharacterized protein